MGQIENKFLFAISESFKAYNKKGGARSTKKLIPIHKFLSETVLNKLGEKFTIKSLGVADGKEATLDGKYYCKDLDIAIFKDMDFPHKPDLMGICLLDLDKNNGPKLVDYKDFDFSAETKKLLQNEFSLTKFLDKFTHLVNLKS